MEQIVDCIKKRDWRGLRRALMLAGWAGLRSIGKTLATMLTVFTLSILAGAGLFVGMSHAIKYQQVLTGTKVVYVMPLEVDDCGSDGCG